MSSGTSAGNIVTEDVATYSARTWRSIIKNDAFGMVSDAQLANIIGANWFNNVDDNLAQLNAWMNGTGVATLIKVNSIETASISLDGDIVAQNIEAESLSISGDIGAVNGVFSGDVSANDGAFSGDVGIVGRLAVGTANGWTQSPTGATDLSVGKFEAVDHGVTIASTTVGRLVFSDVASTAVGYLVYTHASDTLGIGIAGSTELNLNATSLSPGADGGLSLGTSVLRYANAHMTAVTAYSSITLGDATGAPSLSINRDTAQQAHIYFRNEGVTEAHIRHEAGYLGIGRYAAGVYSNAVLFELGAGDVTLPRHLTMSAAGATLSMGSTSGTSVLNMQGASGGSMFFRNSASQIAWNIVAEANFNIDRYSGGALADSIVYTSAGVTFPGVITVGSSATSSAVINLGKSDAGSSSLTFQSNGVARFAWIMDSSENLMLRKYNAAGVSQGEITIASADFLVSLPGDLTMGTGSPTLTLGSGSLSPTINMNKGATGTATLRFEDASVVRWEMGVSSAEALTFKRYDSSGVLQDTLTVSGTTGEWLFPNPIGVSGATHRIHAGSGVPSNAIGANGDHYFRSGGTQSTCIYYKIAGTWTALAT